MDSRSLRGVVELRRNVIPGNITDRINPEYLPWFLSQKGIDAYLARDSYVVLDFETTNRTNGLAIDRTNDLVLACWTVVEGGQETRHHQFGNEYSMARLVSDILRTKFLVAHNAKFELQWLDRCGLDLHEVLVFDTMVMEWVLHGNIKVPYNLNDTAKRYKLGGKEDLVAKLIKYGVCPSTIPQSWLLKYCWKDVDLAHELYKQQVDRLEDEGLLHIGLQRNLVIPVLADIEGRGLVLDTQRVADEEAKMQGVVAEAGDALDKLTGGINLGSPQQLGKFLYGALGFNTPRDQGNKPMVTGSGAPSTAAPALARLVPSSTAQEEFLRRYKEYNLADSMLTKNLNFFKRICDEYEGRFYGQLNQCRTANHRLASSGVKMKFKDTKKELAAQIQNLPRAYKSLFTVDDPEWVVTEYDGSQIEFRVAADLGNDPVAEADIVNGVDIHSFTRDTMNAAYKKLGIDKEIDRQGAKPQTFAPLYGAFGKDAAEQEYAQAFRKKYHGIYETQKEWTLIVADRKKLKTPYGLTFHWPSVTISRSGYISYSTEIFNLPISGLATGEIIPLALVHFWHRIRGLRTQIFNTVHDSIIVRQPKEDVDMVTQIAKQAMTLDVYRFLSEVYKYDMHVPLGFGMKTGTHWGESKTEHKWDVWRDGSERYQIEENKQLRVVHDTRALNGEKQ